MGRMAEYSFIDTGLSGLDRSSHNQLNRQDLPCLRPQCSDGILARLRIANSSDLYP